MEMQGATQKLVLAAEALALNCLQLFSKDRESEAPSDRGKDQEKIMEVLKETFSLQYPVLLQ